MDDVMKIHLLIDNERYPLTIRREDELLYRNAANKEAEVVKEKKLLEVKEKFLNKKAEQTLVTAEEFIAKVNK